MFLKLKDLILETRSFRRFYQEKKMTCDQLQELIDLAALSASPRNRQALKFMPVNTPELCEIVFPTLGWAGALPNWNGPEAGEQPAAYIIILGDNSIQPPVFNPFHEAAYGIAAQSIMLGASEIGFGGCIIASIQRNILKKELSIDDHLEILVVLALGVPKEIVVVDPMPDDGNYNYFHDEHGVHHVPKRSLGELIIYPKNK